MRKHLFILAISCAAIAPARSQGLKPVSPGLRRSAFGVSFIGLVPRGEFARNVDFGGGIGGSYLFGIDPDGIASLRADVGYVVYGSERYRTPLGGGPLGLVNVDVHTTNNIAIGGLGLQLAAPSGHIRPYATATAGFSYFFTESSVEGSSDDSPFASSTNYHDGGFAWNGGAGVYIPVSHRRTVVSLDLGVRWLDNGKRDYLRDDGITFENNDVHLHPVRTEAKAVQFNLGVSFSFR